MVEKNEKIAISPTMNPDNLKELKDKLYKEQDSFIEKKNKYLSLLMIGIILTILGVIFFYLSFKNSTAGLKEFRPSSFEFIISIPVILIGISSLVTGIVMSIKNNMRRSYIKNLKEEIKSINNM